MLFRLSWERLLHALVFEEYNCPADPEFSLFCGATPLRPTFIMWGLIHRGPGREGWPEPLQRHTVSLVAPSIRARLGRPLGLSPGI